MLSPFTLIPTAFEVILFLLSVAFPLFTLIPEVSTPMESQIYIYPILDAFKPIVLPLAIRLLDADPIPIV